MEDRVRRQLERFDHAASGHHGNTPAQSTQLALCASHFSAERPPSEKPYVRLGSLADGRQQGYLSNPDASAQLWEGGYLHTQDIASIDDAGYVQITDRMKDVIKSGGEWVSSLEIENLISRNADVSEVAVIGIKDEKWGERTAALVVMKADAQHVGEDEIREHMLAFAEAGQISKYAVPQIVRFVDALEKTSVVKLNKKWMRERLV